MRKSEHIDELKLGPFHPYVIYTFSQSYNCSFDLGIRPRAVPRAIPCTCDLCNVRFLHIFKLDDCKEMHIYLFKKDCYGRDSNPQQQNKLD